MNAGSVEGGGDNAPATATADQIVTKYNDNKNLTDLDLTDGNYTDLSIKLTKADMNGVQMFRATMNGLDLTAASLNGADAERAVFIGTTLCEADLRNANLKGADLSRANLTNADLRGSWTAGARLDGARVDGLKIDRRALRALGQDHGGLTDADLAALDVEDDQVKLATGFGGFWTAMHLIAATIFILPYVLFGIDRYLAARISPCTSADACVPLRDAVIDYVLTGGKGTNVDILALVIFLLLLVYNGLRVSLVFKTRSLQLAEQASGMPQQFTLTGCWFWAYYGCKGLAWVNLVLVLINLLIISDMPVPPRA